MNIKIAGDKMRIENSKKSPPLLTAKGSNIFSKKLYAPPIHQKINSPEIVIPLSMNIFL